MLYHVPNLLELHRVYLQAIVEPETICVWLHLLTYLIRFIYLLPFSPQISCEWCVIGCARTTGAGARGPTSASPAGISDEAAPASSPATFSTGEQSVHKHFPAILFFSSCDALRPNVLHMSSSMLELIWHKSSKWVFFPWTSDRYVFLREATLNPHANSQDVTSRWNTISSNGFDTRGRSQSALRGSSAGETNCRLAWM